MRRAVIKITPECASQALSILADHGFRVVRAFSSEPFEPLIFGIEGAALPEECSAGNVLLEVRVEVSVDAYGAQRLHRVSKVDVVGPWSAAVNAGHSSKILETV